MGYKDDIVFMNCIVLLAVDRGLDLDVERDVRELGARIGVADEDIDDFVAYVKEEYGSTF